MERVQKEIKGNAEGHILHVIFEQSLSNKAY
jgi:hypothetical protein